MVGAPVLLASTRITAGTPSLRVNTRVEPSAPTPLRDLLNRSRVRGSVPIDGKCEDHSCSAQPISVLHLPRVAHDQCTRADAQVCEASSVSWHHLHLLLRALGNPSLLVLQAPPQRAVRGSLLGCPRALQRQSSVLRIFEPRFHF